MTGDGRSLRSAALTRRGVVTLLLALAALAGGSLAGSNALVLAGGLSSGALAAAYLLGRANVGGLEASRRFPEAIFAGTAFPVEIEIRNRKPILPACLVFVRDRVEGTGVPRLPSFFFSALAYVPPAGRADVRCEGMLFRRGRKRFTGVEVSSAFPLGLFVHRRRLPLDATVVVYPRIDPVSPSLLPDARPFEALVIPVRVATGDEEFAGLREFRPGDNPKWIHWKSVGKIGGRLLVRELERPVIQHVEIVLEATVGADAASSASLERAIRVSASLARELAARGYSVRFEIRDGATEVIEVRPGDASLFALFEALALLEPERSDVVTGPIDEAPGGWWATAPRMVVRAADLRSDVPLEEALRWK